MPGSPLTIRSSSCNTTHSVPTVANGSSRKRSPLTALTCQYEAAPRLRSAQRLHCGVEARSARTLPERLGRARHTPGRARERAPLAARIDRHDHGRWTPDLHLFAALTEFEADLVRERTRVGLEAAGRRRLRRPASLSPEQLEMARSLMENPRLSARQIAAQLGVHRATLYRSLRRLHRVES